MRLCWIVLCGAACGTSTPEPEPTVLENSGRICVVSTNPKGGTYFYENHPVAVQFRMPESLCFSSSCTRDTSASCAIVTSGTTHHVTTVARWTDITTTARACTDDCGILTATCETTAPLPAGDFPFTFGDSAIALTIPSQLSEAPCVEN